jgi:5-formyltetrahydrofolate cyclo-ligase
MFTDIAVADERTPVIATVHDVQVVEEKLFPSETDILVDAVATPTRYINVKRGQRPKGIKWNLLEPEQLASTPPLQELQRMQERTRDGAS